MPRISHVELKHYSSSTHQLRSSCACRRSRAWPSQPEARPHRLQGGIPKPAVLLVGVHTSVCCSIEPEEIANAFPQSPTLASLQHSRSKILPYVPSTRTKVAPKYSKCGSLTEGLLVCVMDEALECQGDAVASWRGWRDGCLESDLELARLTKGALDCSDVASLGDHLQQPLFSSNVREEAPCCCLDQCS
jgi:hypothetical protein